MSRIDRICFGFPAVKHDEMWHHVLYYNKQGTIRGEIDFLGYDRETNTMHIYEMKSRMTPKSVNRAGEQLQRAREYFKKYDCKVKTYLVIE